MAQDDPPRRGNDGKTAPSRDSAPSPPRPRTKPVVVPPLAVQLAQRRDRPRRPTEDEELLNDLAGAPGSSLAVEYGHAWFTHTDPWRVLRIQGEFVSGFNALAEVGASIAVFGSARVREDHPWYQAARELGHKLAEAGFSVITGGGPGLMEAANRGASEVDGALSIGCNIELPFEQAPNPYANLTINFRYFFVRKTMFVKYTEGFVIFPGGFGTLDELFEALTLVQTKKIRRFPIVLYDKAYWKGLIDWLKHPMRAEGLIAPEDLDLLIQTDSIDEICQVMCDCYNERCADAETQANAWWRGANASSEGSGAEAPERDLAQAKTRRGRSSKSQNERSQASESKRRRRST